MRLQLSACTAGALALALALALARSARAEGLRLTQDTLLYSDSDSVMVASPQLALHHDLDEAGGEASARVVVDMVSAASVDVVSHASKRFTEVRQEIDADVSKAFGRHLPSLGYRYSRENDYRSHGVTLGWRETLSPDTTVQASYGLTLDQVGRASDARDNAHGLRTHNASLGLTQVLGPRSLARVMYTLTLEDGYLEKPYRFVPLFDQAGVDLAAARGEQLGLGSFARYSLPERPAEEVPDLRAGHAFALRYLRWVAALAASLRLDGQLYVDSWGLLAGTAEPALEFGLGGNLELSLRGRAYHQRAVGFWQRTYVVSPGELPRYRSMDRELSSFSTLEGGLGLAYAGKRFEAYAEGSFMNTWYRDYLFLDSRYAVVVQAGLRWTP